MLFVDKVRIYLEAGSGGAGCVSFRREKFVPLGGPDGGDGGKGGDIYLEASQKISTLIDFTYQPYFKSEDGSNGRGKNQKGKGGKDLVIKVPCGTTVYKDGAFFTDLVEEDQKVLVAKGGMGGRGNASLRSRYNKAPRFAEKGQPGEKVTLDLELKLIADVGIIGCPNAGKSTLLSCITNASPKIADYPFTTLSPNLGICKHKDKSFVVVDIPGLIEGAHEGRGLGLDFLRHIERTKVLVHIIDIFGYNGRDAFENFLCINEEMKEYSEKIFEKPTVIALNKIDILDSEGKIKEFYKFYRKKYSNLPDNIVEISCLTKVGLKKLLDKVIFLLSKLSPPKITSEEIKKYIVEPEFKIRKEKSSVFVVEGKKIERIASMTDFENEEAIKRFLWILKRLGVEKELKKLDIKKNDIVKIGNKEFVYEEDSN